MKTVVVIIFTVVCSLLGNSAESAPILGGKQQDSTYVRSMRQYLSLRLYNIVKTTNFSIRNTDLNQSFQFNPNNGIGLGLGFTYKILALDLGLMIPGTMRYNGDEPYTKFDLLSTLYGKKHVFDLALQYYEGYFLENAVDFFTDAQLDALDGIRSDITSIDLGLSYLNVMNHDRFSFQAAFLGDKIQRKSAGSPTFHGFLSIYGLQADTALVQHDFDNPLNQQASIYQVGMFSTGTGIGYAHTIVLPKNFFITLSGAPMVMITNAFAEVSDPELGAIEDVRFNFRVHTRNAIGYNGSRFYVIFNAIYDNFFVRLGENTRFDYAPVKLKLFFGYRFGKIDKFDV